MKKATSAFPDTIKFYDRSDGAKSFTIDWQMSVAGADFSSIEKSKHQIYLTLNKPSTMLQQKKIFCLGCHKATGLKAHQKIVDAIYTEFQDKSVQRINPVNKNPDGRDMTYWGKPTMLLNNPTSLLKQDDGKCGAWGNLMVEILKVHSISSSAKTILPPQYTRKDLEDAVNANSPNFTFRFTNLDGRLFVKKWDTSGNPFSPQDLKGIGAQGNKDPHSRFTDHCVVSYDGKIYDPSYGTGPYDNQLAWEDDSIKAFGGLVTVTDPKGNMINVNWIWKNDTKGALETK